MRNFQKKGKVARILESKPALALLGILIIFFAYSLFGLLSKMRETAKNKDIAEAQVKELENNKQELSEDIAQLSTEQGIEEGIREKFGWVKEGEGVIVIVDEKNEYEGSLEADSGGFFSFLKNLFR